jgi:hypothetical protein
MTDGVAGGLWVGSSCFEAGGVSDLRQLVEDALIMMNNQQNCLLAISAFRLFRVSVFEFLFIASSTLLLYGLPL